MTNEELWLLFPIILSEYKDYWKDYFAEERSSLKKLLGKDALKIHHIGSTSIPGLPAKPTIDMLIEIRDETGNLPVPLHLRNAPTKLMKELDYGKDYKYAHSFENNFVD